jgi:hypothetical protein
MKTTYWLWLFIFFLGNCSTEPRQLMLSAEYLSLHEIRPPATGFERKDFVSVTYCPGEKKRRSKTEEKPLPREWGLLEHLLHKAEEQTNAPFFVKASVYHEEQCLILRGYPAVPKV